VRHFVVFYTGKIVLALNNPTIVVITDRNDLDDQLFDTFAACKQLLRQEPSQVESRQQLKEFLRVASGGVIFTTIQKFQPDEGNVYEELSNRRNIVVIADEAHRTQYGFSAKTVDDKNAGGEVIGKKVVYGFAKYLRDALPNATYLGFTGTPIEKTDVNTPAVFGHYVDIYDIAQAAEDGATVRIFYESRLAKVALSEEGRKLIKELDELDDELDQDELTDTQKAKAKWIQMEALIGSEHRIRNIAQDIVSHFEARQEVFAGKGMILCMSRRIAADLYSEIIKLRPQWHSNDLNKGVIKVVMTAASSDGPVMATPSSSGGQTDETVETTIRQVIDQALVSEQVIDIFDAAGLKKPDISILSEDFLMELKGYQHQNIALEVLKKLINDELKVRKKINRMQSRSLMEMLENAINKYHNKTLTAAEVIEELIKISKEIVASDQEPEKLHLSVFEYAFYTAVAGNDSARELMQNDQLRELAIVLTQRVRQNASIDWTIKESVKTKLKVIVKRTLRQFGYQPDMQLLATERVLKQAEMIAGELAA
jgi:type I site-specific restriction-modification system R (restriction) subunit